MVVCWICGCSTDQLLTPAHGLIDRRTATTHGARIPVHISLHQLIGIAYPLNQLYLIRYVKVCFVEANTLNFESGL